MHLNLNENTNNYRLTLIATDCDSDGVSGPGCSKGG